MGDPRVIRLALIREHDGLNVQVAAETTTEALDAISRAVRFVDSGGTLRRPFDTRQLLETIRELEPTTSKEVARAMERTNGGAFWIRLNQARQDKLISWGRSTPLQLTNRGLERLKTLRRVEDPVQPATPPDGPDGRPFWGGVNVV